VTRSVLFLALLAGAACAGEPVGWRTDGTGRYPQAEPPTEWSAEKNVIWKTPLPGRGNSSPVLVADRIFLGVEPDLLVCGSAADGKILWQRQVKLSDTWSEEDRKIAEAKGKETEELKKRNKELDAEINKTFAARKKDPKNQDLRKRYADLRQEQRDVQKRVSANARWAPAQTEKTNGYTSATPVSDGTHVWTVLGTGVAACFDLEGKRKWIRYLDRPKQAHGHSASPLLVEGKLLVLIRYLTALDPLTGETLWKLDKSRSTWGTPLALRVGETAVTVTPKGEVVGVADGKRLTADAGYLEYASPIAADGVIYYPGLNTRALKLVADEEGAVTKQKLWKVSLTKDRYYASGLLHEGLLYVLSRHNTFYVIDAADGKVVKTEKLPLGKGENYTSVTLAGKHIHAGSDNGTTLVIKPGRDYEIVATNKLEYTRSTPVFRGKRMYHRTWKALYCIGE
jgi:outer membrane protein assembly factor BamB